MLFRAAFLSVLIACSALPAQAGEVKQNPKAVLELFTSQGCSSCPEADALLTEMSGKPEFIGLAYHIDYWDYIGWPDTFGHEANSDRQRDYAASWGSSRIFTPQVVINGREGVVGSRRNEVTGAAGKAALTLPVALAEENDMLEITIPADASEGPAVVWLVSVLDRADVRIERGENEGRTIVYTQIVTGRQVVGMWEPGAGVSLKLPLSEVLVAPANGAVILVQQEQVGLPGRILGAASYQR